MRTICMKCQAEYEERPEACGVCFVPDYLAPLPARLAGRDVAMAPRRRVGLVRAGDMRAEHRPAPYGAPFDAWRIGDPHAIELRGLPGGGKSTLATRLAVSAARRVEVLYVAAEEGHALTLQERLARAGLDDIAARRLTISDARTLAELDEDLRAAPGVSIVVLDSVTEIGAAPAAVLPMLLGRSWIAISHVNGRGLSKGGNDWTSACDICVDVEEGHAQPNKNRFGPMGAIDVWDRQEVIA